MFNPKYALMAAGLSVSALCAADGTSRTTRHDLIGAWRLVDIEVQGPAGRGRDPFYGTGSRGLLIYDASGWFSVQIEGSDRLPVPVPAARPVPAEGEVALRAKAAALDSYYAYYGTWSFDAATSTVTHHAKGALYPGEDVAVYPQHVEVRGRQMIFTRTQNGSVQTKRWERLSAD